jgi:hypothetical protein
VRKQLPVSAQVTASKLAKHSTTPAQRTALPAGNPIPTPATVRLPAPTKPTSPSKLKSDSKAVQKSGAKEKLVRDSFTMPRVDFALIQQLKDRALGFKRPTKKSELLRAGLRALAAMDKKALQVALDALPQIKAGRPKQTA